MIAYAAVLCYVRLMPEKAYGLLKLMHRSSISKGFRKYCCRPSYTVIQVNAAALNYLQLTINRNAALQSTFQ